MSDRFKGQRKQHTTGSCFPLANCIVVVTKFWICFFFFVEISLVFFFSTRTFFLVPSEKTWWCVWKRSCISKGITISALCVQLRDVSTNIIMDVVKLWVHCPLSDFPRIPSLTHSTSPPPFLGGKRNGTVWRYWFFVLLFFFTKCPDQCGDATGSGTTQQQQQEVSFVSVFSVFF